MYRKNVEMTLSPHVFKEGGDVALIAPLCCQKTTSGVSLAMRYLSRVELSSLTS